MTENIRKFLKLVSKDDTSGWLKKAKRRQRYALWYDLIFWLKLKWIMYKSLK